MYEQKMVQPEDIEFDASPQVEVREERAVVLTGPPVFGYDRTMLWFHRFDALAEFVVLAQPSHISKDHIALLEDICQKDTEARVVGLAASMIDSYRLNRDFSLAQEYLRSYNALARHSSAK